MNRRYIYYFLLVLLLTDLTYSFIQHYSMPLDGDMASGIVPAEDVKLILNDPFGISVITKNAVYPNPNRYFAHWSFYTYFNHVPLWLQKFVSPISSVYLAAAIAKICIQILIMTLLALYITSRQKFNSDFLIAVILVIPLFQTNGYRSSMGIIDPSVTYTFFYALPCAMLLMLYLPFYYDSVYGTSLMKKWTVKIFVFALAIFTVFNGALNPGIILIITLLYGLNAFLITDKTLSFIKRTTQTFQAIPKTYLFLFSFTNLLSLYALYIGTNNSIFLGETISLGERYARIPEGIFKVLTQKIGLPIFLLVIAINIFLLRRNIKDNKFKKSLRIFNWIGLFALIYILLLPIGGYKEYRPYILRYDTIMPITIGLIFIYAMSSYQLIKHFSGKNKYLYLTLIFVFTFILSNADKLELNNNACEKLALEKISTSKNKVVLIGNDCTILSWDKITDSKNSILNGHLLKKWHITKDNKQYYQSE